MSSKTATHKHHTEHTPAPTVGRIVHFYPFGGGDKVWAAIVTGVYPERADLIDLTTFSPGQPGSTHGYAQVLRRGTYVEGGVKSNGRWDWPEEEPWDGRH